MTSLEVALNLVPCKLKLLSKTQYSVDLSQGGLEVIPCKLKLLSKIQ